MFNINLFLSLFFPTVPCPPVPLNPTLDCVSGSVTMAWQPSSGATSYRALAQGNGGYPSLCNSSSTTCVFTGLLCGLTYSFTVSASDSTCTSVYSSSVQLNTGTTHMPIISYENAFFLVLIFNWMDHTRTESSASAKLG